MSFVNRTSCNYKVILFISSHDFCNRLYGLILHSYKTFFIASIICLFQLFLSNLYVLLNNISFKKHPDILSEFGRLNLKVINIWKFKFLIYFISICSIVLFLTFLQTLELTEYLSFTFVPPLSV